MNFLKDAFTFEVSLVLIALFFVMIFILFLILQARTNKKSREDLMKNLVKTQESLFNNTAELFASKLTEYTDGVLLEKVNAIYQNLISQDLLPSVDAAARKITELSDTVVKRQEMGMAELAETLSELLASKTRDYIKEEAAVINTLQNTTSLFSGNLSEITTTIAKLSEQYGGAYEQSNAVSVIMSKTTGLLGEKMAELGYMLEKTAQSIENMQEFILQNREVVSTLTETTATVQKLANDSSVLFGVQNEKTAALLNETVLSMKQNTELAAKEVLSEFGSTLTTANTSIENAVISLKEIAENINNSATQFALGITSTYAQFGDTVDAKLTKVTNAFSEAAASEYQKITASAENYSFNFTQGIAKLDEALDTQISNLQTIAQQLNNNVTSFKGDVDMSSSRFEVGMEKSVSAALSQIDNSLAEIVKRLITVTVNIQEAADALPKAVKSIREAE